MRHLSDHMKDMFLRVGSELSNDQVLRVYSLLATNTSPHWIWRQGIIS